MIYGDAYEKRKNKINDMIEKYKDIEDEVVLSAMYYSANLEEIVTEGKNLQERLHRTPFSDESLQTLMKNFTQEKFTELSQYKRRLLFQELYNRECDKQKVERKYIVTMHGDPNANYNGYMTPGANELNINGYLIKEALKETSPNIYGKYVYNIGAHSAYTLLHETQHTCQMEGIMNYILKRSKNEEEEAQNAIFFLSKIVRLYANHVKDDKLLKFLRSAYWFDYSEHNSNMAPVKFVKRGLKQGFLKDKVFFESMADRTSLDIHIYESTIENRINNMEYVILTELDVLKEKIKDGPMKNRLVQTLDEFTKKDENGNSKLRESLNKDFNMALEMIDKCKKLAKKDEKKQVKKENEEEVAYLN